MLTTRHPVDFPYTISDVLREWPRRRGKDETAL